MPNGKYQCMILVSQLLDKLRQAIIASGESRYRIANDAGIAESQLSRLMSGERGISVETAERLAAHLGLKITIEPKGQSTKRR